MEHFVLQICYVKQRQEHLNFCFNLNTGLLLKLHLNRTTASGYVNPPNKDLSVANISIYFSAKPIFRQARTFQHN